MPNPPGIRLGWREEGEGEGQIESKEGGMRDQGTRYLTNIKARGYQVVESTWEAKRSNPEVMASRDLYKLYHTCNV